MRPQSTPARCTRKYGSGAQGLVPSAAWRWAGRDASCRTYGICLSDAPEIVQDHPGNCRNAVWRWSHGPQPQEDDSELRDMSRRFWVSAALAVPVFLSAMAAILPQEMAAVIAPKLRQWLEMLVATPVVVWGGWVFYVRAIQSLISRNLNMFTLIGLGVSVAWAYSAVAMCCRAFSRIRSSTPWVWCRSTLRPRR